MQKFPTKLVALGVFVLIAVMYVGCSFSYRSSCVRAENGIVAQYDQDKNNYDNMWKKFREMSQVSDMYASDLKKVYDDAMHGRYGEGGSKAVLQFIKEQNPNLDPAVYVKLQAAIEAGRNSFMEDQKQLLARKQTYNDLLRGNTALWVNWHPWNGFPRIDLSKYDIVTSDKTEDAFKNKKDDEIKLR